MLGVLLSDGKNFMTIGKKICNLNEGRQIRTLLKMTRVMTILEYWIDIPLKDRQKMIEEMIKMHARNGELMIPFSLLSMGTVSKMKNGQPLFLSESSLGWWMFSTASVL